MAYDPEAYESTPGIGPRRLPKRGQDNHPEFPEGSIIELVSDPYRL